MKVDMELEFLRSDGLSHFDMNSISAQVQSFVEQVRMNEGLEAAVVRRDNTNVMKLAIWLSDHDAKDAILQTIAKRAAGIERGLMKKNKAASALMKIARELVGYSYRRIETETRGGEPQTIFDGHHVQGTMTETGEGKVYILGISTPNLQEFVYKRPLRNKRKAEKILLNLMAALEEGDDVSMKDWDYA